MGIPNPLIVHGINEANLKRYASYIWERGGCLVEVKSGADHGVYHIYLPEGTSILEERRIREPDHPYGGYSQIDIVFPCGGWLTWFKLQKIGSGEPHNRINISAAEAPEINSVKVEE